MIGMSNRGVRLVAPEVPERVKRGETGDRSEFYIRMTGTLESSTRRYDWMNRVIGLGLGRPVPGRVVYDMLELM